METNIHAKYYLNDEQVEQLVAMGKPNKTNWYLRNLTTNSFINYDSMLGVGRVRGNTALNLNFPEGTFPAGTEIKAAVGDWDVIDDNGRHCQQTAFFYVNDEGIAIPCKYRDLPSQNGGVIPQLLESEQSTTTAQTQQATLESIAVPVVSNTHNHEDCNYYRKLDKFVYCTMFKGDMYDPKDVCSSYVAMGGDAPLLDCCASCKFHQDLFVKN